MTLDLATLNLVILLTALMLAGAVIVVSGPEAPSRDTLRWWGVGLLLHALGTASFALRFVGWPVVSFVLSNACSAATIATHSLAVARFKRVPVAGPFLWGPIAVMSLVAFGFSDEHATRNLVGAVVFGAQALLLVRLSMRHARGEPFLRGQRLLVAGVLLLGATLVARAAAILASPIVDSTTVSDAIQAGTFLSTFVTIVVNTLGFITMHKDRAEELLLHDAMHDPLTGLLNRRALLAALRHEGSFARRTRGPLSVLMVDIDFFKQVNDRHGHPVGDHVLATVAERLGHRLRAHDTAGRYGGEEFLVLLPSTDLDAARLVAEAIRTLVEQPIETGDEVLRVTVSIGVACALPGPDAVDGAALVAASDRALYRAKAAGRNRCEVSE